MRDDEHPPDLPDIPRPASLPVRITREVAVPTVAIAYVVALAFLLYSGKLQEASFVALVATPVGGYLGSLVPKLTKEAR
jgi:hypothetical protein